MNNENQQPEIWLAMPKSQLDAIVQYLQEQTFREVAPLLMNLTVREAKFADESSAE